MATLAIKGHETRGKEVIEILEMLGGNNAQGYVGTDEGWYYFIDDDGDVDWFYEATPESSILSFTLESFLEKFPYKVGDKVSSKYLKNYKIVKMEWEDCNNRVIYKLQGMGWYSAEELQPYKEQDPMSIQETMKQITDIAENLIKIDIPNGYEFARVDNQQVVFEKVEPQYPKSYEECCDILQLEHIFELKDLTIDEEKLTNSFIRLKRCRDAYWKIAGGWKPNLNSKQHKFALSNVGNKISFEVYGEYNSILCFPTEEMRDVFYENFKELINECKELL